MTVHSTSASSLVIVLALAGCDPSDQRASTQPATSPTSTTARSADGLVANGIVGTWKIDVDRSIKDLTEIPGDDDFKLRHPNLDEYRSFVRQKIEEGVFEIKPDHTALFRSKQGTKELTWELQGAKFWVGNQSVFGSEGHIFEIDDAGSGVCKFQMEWSETVAPRSPLYVTKIRE